MLARECSGCESLVNMVIAEMRQYRAETKKGAPDIAVRSAPPLKINSP
jgi:hypothetical protein